MIDHLGVVVRDYARSKAFYAQALAPTGRASGSGRARGLSAWLMKIHRWLILDECRRVEWVESERV